MCHWESFLIVIIKGEEVNYSCFNVSPYWLIEVCVDFSMEILSCNIKITEKTVDKIPKRYFCFRRKMDYNNNLLGL